MQGNLSGKIYLTKIAKLRGETNLSLILKQGNLPGKIYLTKIAKLRGETNLSLTLKQGNLPGKIYLTNKLVFNFTYRPAYSKLNIFYQISTCC